MRGKTWGGRLKRRLRKPPNGIEAWLKHNTEPVKDEPRRYVGAYMMRDLPCFLKLYRSRFYLHVLPALLRVSKPHFTFRRAVALASYGVPIPRPMTCVMVREGLLLLNESIDGARDYDALSQEQSSADEVRRMMHCAGGTIAAMHMAGYTHSDCQWRNLLWSGRECYLVDLDSVRRRRFLVRRGRARDVARFVVSAEQARLRPDLLEVFLKAYLEVVRTERETLLARMQPQLEKLRLQQEKQHGITAQPLL
ncbi:MAG: lipopolysaccharide kinase InaA family protein [Halioglobus sp.]|nr:lipopolysaccharide kinase InaA family protein [Halioglobus sp.]